MEDPIWDAYLRDSPACHWAIDRQGRIIRMAGAPEGIFGLPCDSLAGRTLAEALAPENAALWELRMGPIFEGESHWLWEQRPSGVWSISLFPVRDGAGSVVYAAGIGIDTTGRNLRNAVFSAIRRYEAGRERMARFLHDSAGQDLSAAGLHLDLIRMDLESTAPGACARILEVQGMLESMMDRVRSFSRELHPVSVDRAGLEAALHQLVERVRPVFSGTIRLIFDASTRTPPLQAAAIYQIASLAVANAWEHSACSLIKIAVQSDSRGPFLEVRDNGTGFDPAGSVEGRGGLGLLTMEYYAAHANLRVSIRSRPGEGTLVRVSSEGGN